MLTSVSSNLSYDILARILPFMEGGALGMISKPLLTGLIYMYMY
jgi:hypothetical protein